MVGRESPKLIEDVIPNIVSLGELLGAVVRGLLKEKISVRDMRAILEAVADAAAKVKSYPTSSSKLANAYHGKLPLVWLMRPVPYMP